MSKDARIPAGRVLVVGLGNPGSKYERTRHNIGWLVLDELARRWRASFTDKKFKAVYGSAPLRDHTATFFKPQTFMNLSGEAVGPAAGFWRLSPEEVIVLHDEIDLEPGLVRLKLGGGHGGHNGLRSLHKHLPSNQYFRVRLGVGRPEFGDVSSWVLGRFPSEDDAALDRLIDTGADAVELLLSEGLLEAQNRVHPMKP